MTSTIDRRTLLRAGLTGAGGLAFGAAFYERAFAAAHATPGPAQRTAGVGAVYEVRGPFRR